MGKAKPLATALAGMVLLLGSTTSLTPVMVGTPGIQAAGLQGTLLPGAPIPANPGELHVTAAGDYSASAAAAGVISGMASTASDLTLALGDLTYGATGAEQAWCDFVTSRTGAGYPFQLVSGNHESNGQNGNINDISACLPNQLPGVVGTYGRQYYVDVPQQNPMVRFIMISPGIPFANGAMNYSAGSVNYNWTASAIDGARAANIPWVVTGMHTPCLSLGQYDCASGLPIANLLLAKNVDLVLSGHEHLYQRTKQLAVSGSCSGLSTNVYNAACVANAGPAMGKGSGTVFATVGTGGVALRDVNAADPEAPYFAASSGLNATPSHGFLDLKFTTTTLSADFAATAGTFQDSFSITPIGANNPPTAAFTSSCVELVCNFDASGSTDSDGTIASYAWAFGDGGTAATRVATRTYAASGSYTVTLTVTDDAGASRSTTSTVVAQQATAADLAKDGFSRTLSGGLGSAEAGGAWSTTGSSGDYSVAAGEGRIRIPAAGAGRNAFLGAVSSSSTETYMELATDKALAGSALYLSAIGRRVSGAGEYRAKIALATNGSVMLSLVRTAANGAETTIQGAVAVPGVTYTVGDKLALRLQVTGMSPTTIRARIWELGGVEPAGWQRSTTDTTTALQGQGGVGLATYLSSGVSNAPVTVILDNLLATEP